MANTKPTKSTSSPSSEGMEVGKLFLHLCSFAVLCILLPPALKIKDVTNELTFYGAYHQDPWNQLIHFVFVPTIVWTQAIIFAHVEVLPITLSLPFIPTHKINHSTLFLLPYAVIFLRIDRLGGSLYLPFIYLMYGSGIRLYQGDQRKSKSKSWIGTGNLMKWAIALNIFSWAMQVVLGHAYFEGSRPALLDSLAQSLTIAPLFAFYEGLWLVGINKVLQEHTLENVVVLTKELCDAGSAMRVCASTSI